MPRPSHSAPAVGAKTSEPRSKAAHTAGFFILAALCAFFLIALLAAPRPGIAGARQGLSLCGEVVIPSLYPFLVLSSFIIAVGLAEKIGRLLEGLMRAVFRLPGCGAVALALGLIGGYPVGASACAELYKKGAVTREEGERLLAFCVNSSPAFIIGAVGAGMLGSTGAGILLYCAHALASLLVGLICALPYRRAAKSVPAAAKVRPKARSGSGGGGVAGAFVGAVTGSAAGIVNICAFVVLFTALAGLLEGTGVIPAVSSFLLRFGIPAQTTGSAARGLLEVTSGCASAAGSYGAFALPLISAFLSWSGISVIFQVASTVRNAGLSVRRYVLSRALHLALSVALTLLLLRLFPEAAPVFAPGGARVTASLHDAPASAAMLVLLSLLLLSRLSV